MHVRWRKRSTERGEQPRPEARGRRVRRWALLAAAVAAALPLGAAGGLGMMSSDGWDLGAATGAAIPSDVDFDELAIDEPLPDDVVKAGFAPDPEFFSDEEIEDGLGDGEIPEIALQAYEDGADLTSIEDPECGVPWSVLAAIGRVESDHGRFGGAQLRPDGYGTKPIRGVALDGRPGIALVRDTERGALDGDTLYDRGVGPMQIIPTTWADVGVDGNGDDRRDPNNIYDAAWGAGVYLCAGDVDLTEPGELARAVRRYNHTDEYVRVVLGLAEAYENGDFGAAPGSDPGSLGETGMDPGVFRDFEDVDPAPSGSDFDDNGLAPRPAPAPGPAPAPQPDPGPAPDPAPAPQPDPAPAPQPDPGPAPAPPPDPAPGPPPTTVPPADPAPAPTTSTTVPAEPPTTTPAPPTTVAEPPAPAPEPAPPAEGEPTVLDPDGDGVDTPPASVGWSPTMLDFVTDTVAARTDCPPPPAADPGTAPPPCPGTAPEGQS